MNITLSTVLNMVLFGSISILLLNYVVSKTEIMLKIGVRTVIYLMIILLLRLFLPFELPYHKNINITKIWPEIYVSLINPIFFFLGREWTILNFMIIFSVIGSCFFLIKLIISYCILVLAVKKYTPVDNLFVLENIDKINSSYKKKNSFKVVESEDMKSPVIIGLFKPCIILPEINLSKTEWYYILCHEMSHFYYKDLWIRLACEILQAIYWWNPFIYLFRNQITKVQEIRVDASVIGNLNELQQMEYLGCLTKFAKLQAPYNRNHLVALYNSGSENEVSKRINIIYNSINGQKKELKTFIRSISISMLLILCIFIIPNFFIIEPYGMAEEHTEGVYNDDEIYLIQKSDGTYDVYGRNEYIGTLTKLPDGDFKIFDEEGRLIK